VTLTEYPDLEQGSEEWLAARCGLVTASVVGQLVTPKTVRPASNDDSRALTFLLVAERITGFVDPVYVNADMARGQFDEPLARNLYADTYAPVAETGFMVREESTWKLGYSPDGLVGDDGLIEVKSPRAKTHLRTILNDEVPSYHMAQIQAGLLVTGRGWLDYLSYSGGMPMWRKRVYPDQRWFDAIVEAVEQFERTAAQMVADYAAAVTDLPTTERILDLEMTF